MSKMDQRRILDGGEKSDEDSLLFGFSLTQKSRIVLGLSTERRTISSFVHAKDDGNPPKAHIPKKKFLLFFSLVSHGARLSLFGAQNCSSFMVVAQTRLDRIRVGVCYNLNHFKF